MKKLILMACTVITLASCNTKQNSSTADSTKLADNAKVKQANAKSAGTKPIPANDTLITLNGVGWTVSDAMQKHFIAERGQDKNPIQKSFWFDSNALHLMVTLLNKEIKQELDTTPNRPDTTDGVRIYFVSDTTVSSGQLNNSIVLVSTRNNGTDVSVPSGAFHRDYYYHDKSDPLFKNLNEIKGAPSIKPGAITTDGQNLYNNIYFGTGDNTTCADPHYIGRRRAHKMLGQFGLDAIRTTSEWFNINLLRSFDNEKSHDGFRIYFTRHPKQYTFRLGLRRVTLLDTDSLKEAFVLVTTQHKRFPRDRHEDYFNCLSTNHYYDMPNVVNWFKRHPQLLGAGGSGGDDNGEICPSHCN